MLSAKRRLRHAYEASKTIAFDSKSKLVILSDCHRGQGNSSDNFLQNQPVYLGALQYYFDCGFTYIELGDGDELWENRCLKHIVQAHSSVFGLLSKFYRKDRLIMLYGNHDAIKQKKAYRKRQYNTYYCDSAQCHQPLFPGIDIPEGIILENRETKQRIFLTHGHQVSFLNDVLWHVAKFLVRHVWKPLETIGFLAPVGPERPFRKAAKAEKKLSAFADENGIILIAGHTHRPVFPTPAHSSYFNDGSCVHPGFITAIEIENGQISLVKWSVSTRRDRTLYIGKELMAGPADLAAYDFSPPMQSQ